MNKETTAGNSERRYEIFSLPKENRPLCPDLPVLFFINCIYLVSSYYFLERERERSHLTIL